MCCLINIELTAIRWGESHPPQPVASAALFTFGFCDRSVDKESVCNAGDPQWIPGSGRSTWEGIGYPLQYSWASLVSQLVKKLPAMQETWVWSLGWGDPLEKGMATHSNILAWRIPRGHKELDTTDWLSLSCSWPTSPRFMLERSFLIHEFSP